jgi:hypothetical protein
VTIRAPEESSWWILRVGVFCCFLGHGAFGIITKAAWLPFFAAFGIGPDVAYRLMPLIGAADIVLGVLALVRPRAALLAYMVLWTTWTAALRPIVGLSIFEMLERAGNVGAPLALLLMCARADGWATWLRPAQRRALDPALMRALHITLALTVSLLLLGHGALAIEHKAEIASHVSVLLHLDGAFLDRGVLLVGATDITLAVLTLARPSAGLFLGVCVWKLATESLFLVAGAPAWEVIERGGSYAAPLALAMLLWRQRAMMRVPSWERSMPHDARPQERAVA